MQVGPSGREARPSTAGNINPSFSLPAMTSKLYEVEAGPGGCTSGLIIIEPTHPGSRYAA